MSNVGLLTALLLAADGGIATTAKAADGGDMKPVICDACAEWNRPQPAFRIHGNTHYVGVKGLGAVLIETSRGLILIDGGLPQSVPLIVDNIAAVGRRIDEVKWIVSSHPHYDHTGGIAALARLSGARVAASPEAAAVLRAGMVTRADPQFGFGEQMRFPPVPGKIRELRDGATLRLGDVTLKVHHTPAHSPGGTSWTWRSCEKGRCLDMVYADSLNAVSSPEFRFTSDQPRIQRFRRIIEKVRNLPCDVLVSAHPSFSGVFEKQAARGQRAEGTPAPDPMIDREGCRRYADAAAARLDKRLADEARPPPDARPAPAK